ncbi:isomerase [Tenacibaculum sp. SZ-18]|uniref:PhzF family phenazine biosynthesis protein n=1 Tax=Tenacibaculum sp. SZ-18 TaxID=754423 RepID=UPI000C2D283E|nr:PhzF family phenazine biosynthesis protein [Tenacibaculum sp. SZ-18]AUC16563.1 isomerase [Tenacibaculum sp. SZ-18]
MELEIYQIDAFTAKVFGGNPAAVCPLEDWIDSSTMQSIAAENNLSETVFFVRKKDFYEIRWFMPHQEIDLCGHATLAAAYVIFSYLRPELNDINFMSQSGILKAQKSEDGSIILDFPSRPPKKIEIPQEVYSAFNYKPIEALASRDLVLLFENEEKIRTLKYDLNFLKKLPYLCIVPTAKGIEVDFVSRVFDANASMPEDPVTGSAHTSLIPYWSEKLKKKHFIAKQLSEREGDLICNLVKDRVHIAGKAVLYLKGKIYI